MTAQLRETAETKAPKPDDERTRTERTPEAKPETKVSIRMTRST